MLSLVIGFFSMVRLKLRNSTLPKISDGPPIAPAVLALQGQHGDHYRSVLTPLAGTHPGRFHSCQPLNGQVVEILEVKHGVDGILGLDLAKVRVLGGHCDGSEGWVGLQRLAVAQ